MPGPWDLQEIPFLTMSVRCVRMVFEIVDFVPLLLFSEKPKSYYKNTAITHTACTS